MEMNIFDFSKLIELRKEKNPLEEEIKARAVLENGVHSILK